MNSRDAIRNYLQTTPEVFDMTVAEIIRTVHGSEGRAGWTGYKKIITEFKERFASYEDFMRENRWVISREDPYSGKITFLVAPVEMIDSKGNPTAAVIPSQYCNRLGHAARFCHEEAERWLEQEVQIFEGYKFILSECPVVKAATGPVAKPVEGATVWHDLEVA